MVPLVMLRDGAMIPQIAYGTGTKHRGTDISALVTQAIEAGFAHIDAAQVYRNEDTVGVALQGVPRDNIFVTSKYFTGDIEDVCHSTLRKLGLEHLDLYLIHMPGAIKRDVAKGWKVMESLQTAGLTRSIGVSNYSVEDLEDLLQHATVKPSVNQIRLHLYCYKEQKPLIDLCARHNITIEAYNVLTPITQAPGGPVDIPLHAAAHARGCTPAQVLFMWLLSKGAVIISTTSNRERMNEYLGAASFPPLTANEVAALEEAGAQGPLTPLKELQCATCMGYNCTYCTRFAGVPFIGQDDAVSRASRTIIL